jgi:uncharacterized protein (TIGR03083 family)
VRAAAQILLAEAGVLPGLLHGLPNEAFDRPTVCTGWSVRDVLAHCSAALHHVAAGTVHSFSPEDNERDVVARRSWPVSDVLDELYRSYQVAARAIDAADGRLDGMGLGEWIHGGDVREAIGVDGAYVSEGADLAMELLIERSIRQAKPQIVADISGQRHWLGTGVEVGRLTTDLETFIRLCGGRNPDPVRYELIGLEPDDLVLFT